MILRALGTRPELAPASWERPLPLRAGDCLLLSSDGLHDVVDDDEIRRIVVSESRHNACERLVEAARLRGGPDNITVAVLTVGENGGRRAVPKPTRPLEVPRP